MPDSGAVHMAALEMRADVPSLAVLPARGTLTESVRSRSDDYDDTWRHGYATL
ncbi:unnamed protein product [marine sediment metagenome]|uniref:Uncharacterized protein n=1 Tax=marine sediment metagenome TaxID=412755 RepID=X0W6Y4_9ZZZZ